METSFGNWVKRRRKALDFTQEQLAQQVGCSMSAIFKFEADERRPSRQIAELLALHLEIPPDQRELFLKVARQEKGIASLSEIQPVSGMIPAAAPEAAAPEAAVTASAAPNPPQNNLPVFPTPFIGREHEINIVASQLQDAACRLLTLTGPGGVGKTRLAIEVARKLEDAFSDGVFFLPMVGVNQPESMLPAIADAFGVVFSGPADPRLQVNQALRGKHSLLVLDNMEHLVAGGSLLVDILQQAPDVKMLLTSREQVNLQWEWIFEVQGLPIPEEASGSVLETNSAVSLLLQRARQASPDLSLSPEEAAALVRICKFVDGLPLAIELAASWARVMSFSDIASELERNLDLLETSMQDMPARHRSIKMVFDHSRKLLTADEYAVLMRLSIFPAGFTRKAAESVAGASLGLLSALVRKSLLRYGKQAGHYDFHELIRQFTLAELYAHPDEEAQTLEASSRYYARWLKDLEAPLKSPQQMNTSGQIRAETANWILAWRWAVQQQRFDLLQQMVPCLYWYYEIHGYYAEALSTYTATIRELRAAGAPETLSSAREKSTFAFLVEQYAWFLFRTGEIEQAEALFTQSLALARAENDPEVLYHIYGNWGYMALLKGAIDQAKSLTIDCQANAQALSSPWHIAIPINVLGIVELQQGNISKAHEQLLESLKIWYSVGDPRGLIFCMLYLSTAALALGSYDDAERFLKESNAIAAEKMDRWAQAFGLDLLGQTAVIKQQYETAREFFLQSLTLSREIGDQWRSTFTLIHLGSALASLGQLDEAKQLFREAYANAYHAKWMPTIAEVLVAHVSADSEMEPEKKLAAAQAVHSLSGVMPHTRQQAEQLRDRLISKGATQPVESANELAGEMRLELLAQEIFNGKDAPSLAFGDSIQRAAGGA